MQSKPSKTVETRIIPAKVKFLSEVMTELPKNCLFNKGRVGGGGTTIALQNSIPTVVCVPFNHIISNKVSQSQSDPTGLYPYEVFGLYGGVSDAALSEYLDSVNNTEAVAKIMVTYDSLDRVVNHPDLNPSDFYLLIDEYHCLVTEYSYRKTACLNVLKHYTAFNSFTFMTATPISDDHLFEQLKSVDVVNASWEKNLDLKVVAVECKNGVQRATIAKIGDLLKHDSQGNFYFFINAIQFINSIISTCGLTEQNCRIICSKNSDDKLPWPPGKLTDLPKKFNFVTKTAFEGADIYDVNGHVYILSDASDHKTMVNVSIQLKQIAGRIRNSKHSNVVYHYFSCVFHADKISYQEFEEELNLQIDDEKACVSEILDMKTPRYRIKAAAGSELLYHIVDHDKMEIRADTNAAKFALYTYKLKYQDYLSIDTLTEEYNINKLLDVEHRLDLSDKDLANVPLKYSFKITVRKLKYLRDTSEGVMGEAYIEYSKEAFKIYDFLEQAIKVLGFVGIEKAKYKVFNIKRKVVINTPSDSEGSATRAMAALLHMEGSFDDGSKPTKQHVKAIMNKCYGELSINKKATSKDIETYYNVLDTTVIIKGKQNRAVVIISKRNL